LLVHFITNAQAKSEITNRIKIVLVVLANPEQKGSSAN
jgi:hypothetical protein